MPARKRSAAEQREIDDNFNASIDAEEAETRAPQRAVDRLAPQRPVPGAARDATAAAPPPWMRAPAMTGDVNLANPSTPNEIRGAMGRQQPRDATTGQFTAEESDRMADEAAAGFAGDVKKKLAAQKRARS